MNEMLIAALLWVGTHLGLSSTPLRAKLVGAVGEQGFLGIYSLMAFATLGYLICIYGFAATPREIYFWLPNPDLFWVAKVLMPVAFVLAVGSFMVKNPTMVGMQLDAAEAADLAKGVTRITRHPFQWGVILWAFSHMVANGDGVSLLFFSSFLIISLGGTMLMDRKKAASFGTAWDSYIITTSNLPFAAIIGGRNRLVLAELWLPALAGLVVYALFYYGHDWITGTVII
ncbi:MAG: NnrU family protein [Pseudomonadota bacterium]